MYFVECYIMVPKCFFNYLQTLNVMQKLAKICVVIYIYVKLFWVTLLKVYFIWWSISAHAFLQQFQSVPLHVISTRCCACEVWSLSTREIRSKPHFVNAYCFSKAVSWFSVLPRAERLHQWPLQLTSTSRSTAHRINLCLHHHQTRWCLSTFTCWISWAQSR